MLYEFLSLHECGIIKIPENFLFLSEELSGIFAFMDLWSQIRFAVCGYRSVNGLGFRRDSKSLGFWASNRGERALLAHDFPLESLVCYTFCDR